MAVRVITAPPGYGKTLNMTRIPLDLFKEENKENIIQIIKRKKKKEEKKYKINIYSNYPIMLKKAKNGYTLKMDMET